MENEARYVADSAGQQGGGTLYVVDEARDGLRRLSGLFPGMFARALGRLGSTIRKDIRQAMENGGPYGAHWAPLVKWQPNKRQRSARKRRKRRSRYSSSAVRFFERSFTGETRTGKPYGRIYSAGRYLLNNQALTLSVGWVGNSAAYAGKAVQASMRGAKNDWRFLGSQPVTRSMRRALAAVGIVLSKSKRELKQAERPLMSVIYGHFEPQIQPIIESALAEYLTKANIK